MPGRELAPIASLRLSITIILFNNGSFGWIKMRQKLYDGERYLGIDFTGKWTLSPLQKPGGPRRAHHPFRSTSSLSKRSG